MAPNRVWHEQEVLTTKEVCKLLRLSRQTVYKLIDQGKLPGKKVGQSYKFLKSELIEEMKGNGRVAIRELRSLGLNELEFINP